MAVSQPIVRAYGELELKKAVGKKLTLRGYGSTKNPDLGGDVCPPDSWDEFLPLFKANPLYCYAHWFKAKGDDNQIPPYPIGKIGNPHTDDMGLMFEDIQLCAGIPLVDDILSPLIQDGILKQQSVGFYALKQEQIKEKGSGKTYNYLTRNFIQEGSIVPLAANPFGTDVTVQFKTIDGFQDYDSLSALLADYEANKLVLAQKHFVPSNYEDIPSQVFSGQGKTEQHKEANQMETLNPTFKAITATEHVASAYDPTGAVKAKPRRYEKTFDKVASLIYAGFTQEDENSRKEFVFEIGVPTEKGFAYSWEKVALATAKVLGAKGGAKFSPDEKAAILQRLEKAYDSLGKTFPYLTKSEESIVNVAPWKLAEIAYHDVSFTEGEDAMFLKANAAVEAKGLLAALKIGGLEDVPEIEELRKYMSGSVNLSLSVSVGNYADPDDAAFVNDLVSQIATYCKKEDAEDMQTSFHKWQDASGDTLYARKVGEVSTQVLPTEKGFKATETVIAIPETAIVTKNLLKLEDAGELVAMVSKHFDAIKESGSKFPKKAKSQLERLLEDVNDFD